MTDAVRIGADIMNAEYGDVDLELFRMKYSDNPYGRADSLIIQYEDDKPAGIVGFIGMRLHANNRTYEIAQGSDIVVSPAYRGRSIMSRLIHTLDAKNKEMDLVFALPNEKSYPRALHLGFRDVTSLYHYIYAVNPGGFLIGRSMITRIADAVWHLLLQHKKYVPVSGEVIEESRECRLGDKDYESINAGPAIGFERSAQFYRWKTGYHKSLEFHYLTLRRNGALCAHMLYHVHDMFRGKALVVDDWYCSGSPTEKKRRFWAMLNSASAAYDLVHVPFVNKQSEDDAFLRKLHFFNACRKPFGRRVCPLIVYGCESDASMIARAGFKNVDSDVMC